MIIRSQFRGRIFIAGAGTKIEMKEYYKTDDGYCMDAGPIHQDANYFVIECNGMAVGAYSTKENTLSVIEEMYVALTSCECVGFQMPQEENDEI